MASSRAQEEKNLKAIRELMKLPANKQCFDCGQKGPVYANCTIGTFICTPCSGIHRELSHRCKSVSMSTFTAAEVEKLTTVGNENASKEWHSNWNPSEYPAPDGNDVGYLRKFLVWTYTDRKFSGKSSESTKAPTSSKTKKTTSPSSGKTSKRESKKGDTDRDYLPQPEPLSNILGHNIPPLDVGTPSSHSGSSKSPRRSTTKQSDAPLVNLLDDSPVVTSSNKSTSSSDILGDLLSLNVSPAPAAPANNGYHTNSNGSFNPFPSAASAGPSSADAQQIAQLTQQVQHMQAAIMSAKQQMTAVHEQIQRGMAVVNQLNPQQREQLGQLQQRYQAMSTQFTAMNQQYSAAATRLQQMQSAAQARSAHQPSLFDTFGGAPTTGSTSSSNLYGSTQPSNGFSSQPSSGNLYGGATGSNSSSNLYGNAMQPNYGAAPAANNGTNGYAQPASGSLYGNGTASNSSSNFFGAAPTASTPTSAPNNGYGAYGSTPIYATPTHSNNTDFFG